MKIGQWLGIIAIVVSLYIVWQIRHLLLLAFTAIVLATALNGLVRQLLRWRLKRGGAVLIVITGLALIAGGVGWLIVPPFLQQFSELITTFPIGLSEIQQGINWLENQIIDPYLPNIPDFNGLLTQLQPLGRNLLAQGIALFTTSINALLEVLLVLILTLMVLINPQAYRQSFIRFFPAFYRSRIDEVLTRCAIGIESWTQGALIEMVFIGALSGIGLWILQVPLALAHAVLAGLLNFIPNIGPTLSAVFPITIAFVDAPWKALAVLILYIVIQNIESYWLTPTVMAHQVKLLPALTLVAQIFFTTFFGALGLLMALPLAVVVKTWLEEVLFKDILDRWQKPT
ncbi:AI-2E family transporter [Leptolyngbya sp. AN03gr2]|uniref:AI-2E family transporter n=1 Tax=unclassified Leptolyngbya TaxID=2650499 RepID=UPI003D31AE37